MLLFTLTSITLSLSLSIILASSPLSLGLWILTLALVIATLISFSFSSWFALIIFLVYIGGILVMFAYFTALMPNQPLEIGKILSILSLTFILLSFPLFSIDSLNLLISSSSYPSPILLLFTPYNVPIILFIALILFFILVAVVKVANIFRGPLRPFNYV